MKKGDFIKVNLTGKLPDGQAFDKTEEPLVVCVGEAMLLPGIDAALLEETGKFTIELKPEEAFGKKDPKQLQMVPTEQLKKQGIRPQVGMQLDIDGGRGVVKNTGGGRTVVDFNHPLAGKDVVYDVEIVETITDETEQVASLLGPLGVPKEMVSVKGKEATIQLPAVPPQPIMDMLNEKITGLTKITTVHFEQGKK